MGQGAYIMSVVGESPAVLSELLWWIGAVEGRPIAGIEVWATGRGSERLRKLVQSGAWDVLTSATGPLPAMEPVDAPPDVAHGFRVHRFAMEDGRILDDVRSQAESAAVSEALHDRVRELRRALSDKIQLIGSLAGGRKTVSAALQTAFSLQSGPTDRLVHVLLDSRVEAHLRQRGTLTSFHCPTPRWEAETGVPAREQVQVYDVPFPRLRHLVNRRLSDALDNLGWRDVWPVLDANMGRNVVGRLTRIGWQSWSYAIVDKDSGREVFPTPLGKRTGAVMAAMAASPAGAEAADLVRWLDDNRVGWTPSTSKGPEHKSRCAAVRQAATALRKVFANAPVGLEPLYPPESGFHLPGIQVDLGHF